jgi:outer membrane protein OmpA-like peptidoglycan-associated protein
MEGLLGFLHEPANAPMWIKVGVGAGLTRAFGTPDARLFVQMGYQADGRGRRPEPVPAQVDTDRDGIFDVADACVRDPEEQPLMEGDDGCPEIDTDRDGIVDGLDRCPLLAEDLDAFQDEEGCPDPDNDGDSVPDVRDGHRNPDTSVMMLPSLGIGDCANVAETWNGKEDQDGCPDAGLVEVRGDRIVLFEPVYFDTNLATIRPESAALLSEVAAVMQTWPQIERVEVQGHADARGADLDNYALSDARAAAVRLWLIQRGGVAPERLIARGYGEDRPMIPSADTPGELALNRRVQLVILKMRDGGPKTLVGR